MAGVSTRKRIQRESVKMLYDVENAQCRLQRIEELAEGHSIVVNASLSPLLQMLETVHEFVDQFRLKL